MLQAFYLDVAKVDLDVTKVSGCCDVARVSHGCCLSRYFIFIERFRMFHTKQVVGFFAHH